MVFSSFGITSPSFYSSLGFYSAVYIPPYRKWHKNLGQSLCTSCTLMMMMCRMCLVPASSILYLLKLFNRMTVCSGSFSSIFFFSGFTLCDQVTTNRQRAGRKTPSRIETKPERLIHTPSHLASVQTLSKSKKKKRNEGRGKSEITHTVRMGGRGGESGGNWCLSFVLGEQKKIYSKAKAKANALARNWQLG